MGDDIESSEKPDEVIENDDKVEDKVTDKEDDKDDDNDKEKTGEDVEKGEEEEEEEEGVKIDNEEDRNYSEKLVGEKIRGNYETGWHTGTIQWFNTKLMEYNVLFEDGSDDYITTDDIDGVDIILVPSEEYEKKPIYKRPRSPLVKDDDSDSDFTVSDDSDDDKGSPAPSNSRKRKRRRKRGSIGPDSSDDNE